MITVEIDRNQVEELCREEIAKRIQELDAEFVYWDAKELMQRTCVSWNFIQEQFFFNPQFPKFKIGKKWYFPVRETREFLEKWIRNQSKE